jgi:uncharacterized protein YndB with AHSA1/START domain
MQTEAQILYAQILLIASSLSVSSFFEERGKNKRYFGINFPVFLFSPGQFETLRFKLLLKKNEEMKNLKKYYELHAQPSDVYNALTNKTMLEIWTGETAEMEPVAGTQFSLWDGAISGINLEFEPNKKIVQQWFFEDQDAPSIVTIKLHESRKGTSVEVIHTNIPDEAFSNIAEGWDEDYFGSLRELFI